MLKRIFLTMIFTVLGVVAAVLSIGFTSNWGQSPWLFPEGWFDAYIANFQFQVWTIDVCLVLFPALLGAFLFLINFIVSLIVGGRRLLTPFILLAFAATIWSTYVYAVIPAPVAALPGVLCYVAIFCSLLGQLFALGKVKSDRF